jgi:hypothetical protein
MGDKRVRSLSVNVRPAGAIRQLAKEYFLRG